MQTDALNNIQANIAQKAPDIKIVKKASIIVITMKRKSGKEFYRIWQV